MFPTAKNAQESFQSVRVPGEARLAPVLTVFGTSWTRNGVKKAQETREVSELWH